MNGSSLALKLRKTKMTANQRESRFEFSIAVATLEDVAGIREVEKRCFPKEEQYSYELIRGRIAGMLGDAYARRYFVAKSDGRIIGYGEAAIKSYEDALMGRDISEVRREVGRLEDRVGTLISVGVLPEMQGKGVGALITESRLEYLRENNIRQVFVHSWPNGGFPHIAKKMGFIHIPCWTGRQYCDGTRQQLYYKDLAAE
jgi:GNAT superfamily N-acetyltransferase